MECERMERGELGEVEVGAAGGHGHCHKESPTGSATVHHVQSNTSMPMEVNKPAPRPFRTPRQDQVVLRLNSWEWATERGNFGVGSQQERRAADGPWCQEARSSSNLGSFISYTMAEFGPVSSKVADVQLSHDSVTVPGGDLRARSEPKPVSSGGEGEHGSIEGTVKMIQMRLKCVCARTRCSSSRVLIEQFVGSEKSSFSKT